MTVDVAFFSARGCHLCQAAREVLDELAGELGFAYREVEISGVPELEDRYRELLPVVELDGRRAFAYVVPPDAFRRAYAAAQTRGAPGSL